MFRVDDEWEYVKPRELLRAIAGKPHLRAFGLIEIAPNVELFHVDAILEDSTTLYTYRKRLIMSDIKTVLDWHGRENVKHLRITLQSRADPAESYSLRRVLEVFERKDEVGRLFWICKCNTGSDFFQGPESAKAMPVRKRPVTRWIQTDQ